jgi:hypothetical protein
VCTLGAQNIDRQSHNETNGFRDEVSHVIAQEGDEFLDSIVTGDESWVFHHTLELKQQSLQWHHTHSHMTECTAHLAGLWIGNAISNTSHSNKARSTTAKQAWLTGKG